MNDPKNRLFKTSQVVWAESTEVGCGVARFVNGLDWHTFVVCQYESAGNVNGQYQQQVQPLIASATVPSGPGYLEAQSSERNLIRHLLNHNCLYMYERLRATLC